MTPHQGQQTTPTGQPAASSGSGGDLLSRVSVTSDQVAMNGHKCMFTLSPGRFAAVSKYRGRVLIHVRDYVIDALSGKMYATKRGVAMKVDEWENLKSNIYAIDAAISVLLHEKYFLKSDILLSCSEKTHTDDFLMYMDVLFVYCIIPVELHR